MAGFEVVVRPVVFPNIRPAPARALAPEDNPEDGITILLGSGGKLIDLSLSESSSWSRSNRVEQKRRFDVVRTYPKKVPKEKRDADTPYVDTERVNKMWEFKDYDPVARFGELETVRYADTKLGDNEEMLQHDVLRENPDVAGGGGGESSFDVGGED